MLTPKLQVLQRTLKRLIRRSAAGALERVIAKTHAADLAFLLADFSASERVQLIERCNDDEKRAATIATADPEIAAALLHDLRRDRALELLNRMEPDDVSDILEEMSPEIAEEILEKMRDAARREVEELSGYGSATAGGIMSPRFFALQRDTMVREAIEALQRVETEPEIAFYVYVVDEEGRLHGVLSLRQLVTTKPDRRIADLMTTDVISVGPDVDQEEVAKLASRYGLLAVPVVDGNHKLLGIVTIDDVIAVLHEEAQEDILRMAGAGERLEPQQNVLRSVLSRFPWLLAAGVGGAVSAAIVGAHVASLLQYLPLIFFIPLVLGLAGVAGLQSATVIAQNIAQGRLGARLLGPLVRQGATGLVLGAFCGALVAAFGWFWWGPGQASVNAAPLILGAAIAASMAAAAIFGGLLPMLFNRLRFDPALATGPLVAIVVDLLALLLYLSIGSSFL